MSLGIVANRIRINGRVQGVLFRRHAKAVADNLGLVGWIRNNDDGSVETLVQGNEENVKKFLDWCQKGPDLAMVNQIEVRKDKAGEGFFSFEIVG